MFEKLFISIQNIYYRHNKYLQKFSNNKTLLKLFRLAKFYLFYKIHKSKPSNIHFYSQNVERVNAVSNILADEKSKNIYNAMVKYRQTHSKKDFPISYYTEPSYFVEEIVSNFDKDEVFIDCGAFNGDTIDDFLKYCPEYNQIIAFEPENKLFEELKIKYKNNSKIMLLNEVLSDENNVVLFNVYDIPGGRLFDEKDAEKFKTMPIHSRAIDSLDLPKVTFIKMDIEGAEIGALKGAEKTIIRDKPKLAICIYHSNEDMIYIAEYIHNIVPEYKFYVGQHAPYPYYDETVLYAVL